MEKLAQKKCVPCSEGVPPLQGAELATFLKELPGWNVVEEHHLEKTFTFKNFEQALAFTNKVGAVAEAENHHPDIHLSWGKVKIVLWTHKIDGLSESDCILAAKIDEI